MNVPFGPAVVDHHRRRRSPLWTIGVQRKVVTMLFCDVVGSTALGKWVDPGGAAGLLARHPLPATAISNSTEARGVGRRQLPDCAAAALRALVLLVFTAFFAGPHRLAATRSHQDRLRTRDAIAVRVWSSTRSPRRARARLVQRPRARLGVPRSGVTPAAE